RVGEDPAVHLRVEGDDAVAEDRRVAGEIGHVRDRDPGVGDRAGRAAARDQTPAQPVEALGQLDDAGLVVHGEQRGGHAPTVTNGGPAGAMSATPRRTGTTFGAGPKPAALVFRRFGWI